MDANQARHQELMEMLRMINNNLLSVLYRMQVVYPPYYYPYCPSAEEFKITCVGDSASSK